MPANEVEHVFHKYSDKETELFMWQAIQWVVISKKA